MNETKPIVIKTLCVALTILLNVNVWVGQGSANTDVNLSQFNSLKNLISIGFVNIKEEKVLCATRSKNLTELKEKLLTMYCEVSTIMGYREIPNNIKIFILGSAHDLDNYRLGLRGCHKKGIIKIPINNINTSTLPHEIAHHIMWYNHNKVSKSVSEFVAKEIGWQYRRRLRSINTKKR